MSFPVEMNPEGLTWSEWYAATGRAPKRVSRRSKVVVNMVKVRAHVALRHAWARGEDPAEYRK